MHIPICNPHLTICCPLTLIFQKTLETGKIPGQVIFKKLLVLFFVFKHLILANTVAKLNLFILYMTGLMDKAIAKVNQNELD
jgi:hypothetical protein